ncbi:MAG: GNAT family N-acetyltransferase [Mycobacteriaceae bacterium]
MNSHGQTPTDSVSVHAPEHNRYELQRNGNLAGFCEYTEQSGIRNFNHTLTMPDYRGQGVAGVVTRFALDDCKENHIQILPSCSFVLTFVRKNPEYRELIPQHLQNQYDL